jgi:hypothetical protein
MLPVKTNALLCTLALHLALLPAFADVIPSRRAERDPEAQKAVQSRLERLGLPATEARRHVNDLTAAETAYFAADVNRVQAAGGLYWYEWIIGLAFLGGLAAAYFWVTSD